jgi:hypothetical protein
MTKEYSFRLKTFIPQLAAVSSLSRTAAPETEKYLVHLLFSVYLGWITIATIANVTALLVDVNWNTFGLGEQFWAVTVIVVGIAIALSILFTRKDIFLLSRCRLGITWHINKTT